MNDVFISYSRRNKDFTQKLYTALMGANRTVWADWDSIPAASDWFAEIKQGIEEANSVLFVLSSEWLKSNECRKELTYAVEMGKRLFPILYEPVDPNDVPPELAKINWVYMRDTDDFEKAFQTLCTAMDTDLDWIKSHTRIQIRAVEWDKKNRDLSFVLRGKDLTDGEQFITGSAGKTPEATPLQGEYILISRKDATRRQRITLAGVVAALIVSIALGIAALFSRQAAIESKAKAEVAQANAEVAKIQAEEAQLRAETEARIANSGRLSLEAESSLGQHPQRALLLALEAVKVNEDANESVRPDAEKALRMALDHVTGIGLTGFEHEVSLVQFTKDGRWLVAGTNVAKGEIKIWNFEKALADFSYEPFYISFPVEINYASYDNLWSSTVELSPQTNWLVVTVPGETKLWQIDDEDEVREPLVFEGEIKFANLNNDSFVLENQGTKVVYWQIDPEALTKKELATFKGGLVSLSEDYKYLITDDAEKGLLFWNFSTLSSQPSLLTEKHLADFNYIKISPKNDWLVLFEDNPRPEYQIPKYDETYTQIGTQPWNSTSIVLISLTQANKREYKVDLDFYIETLYLAPKFSEDGNSFVYMGMNSPDEFGNPSATSLGVLRFADGFFTNLTNSSKTDSYSQFSFINDNWLYVLVYKASTDTNVGNFFDLRTNDLFADEETSLLLLTDDNGDVTLSEDGMYLTTDTGDLINFSQLDFNQVISVEPAPQNTEAQASNSLAIELSSNPKNIGLEENPTKTAQTLDGKWFVAGGFDGSLRVWNNSSPRIASSIQLPDISNYIALSNDNQWLAEGSTLWQLENGKPKKAYPFETEINEYGSKNTFISIFSPDSRWLAYIYINDINDLTSTSIKLIDLSKVSEEEKVTATVISKVNSVYTTVQFSQNGSWILVGDELAFGVAFEGNEAPPQSFVYDLENKKHYSLSPQVANFSFTEDQNHIILATAKNENYLLTWQTVEVWSLPSSTNQQLTKTGELKITNYPYISQNGRWMFVPSFDSTTNSQLWDLNCIIEKSECKSFELLQVQRASFSPNSEYLVTEYIPNPLAEEIISTYEIWSLQNNQPEKINSHTAPFSFPSISKNGDLISFVKSPTNFYSSASNNTAGIFSSWFGYNSTGGFVSTFDGYGHLFYGGGGGGGYAFGGYQTDYSAEAFTTTTNSFISLRGHEFNISANQISPNENFVLTFSGLQQDDGGDSEKILRLWQMDIMRLDPTTKPVALPLDLSAGNNIYILSFSPDSRWVYAIDATNTLHYFSTSIEELKKQACIALGRNLTISEWERFFANTAYRKTCENLPEHPSALVK